MKQIIVENRYVTPSKVICIGRNYYAHIDELGNEVPENMVFFLKPNSAISENLTSFHQEPLHYEGELSFLHENGRFSAVGFGLDLTKRALQSRLKEKGLPWERAKAFDGAALFSQFIKIPEVSSQLTFELEINGTTAQSGSMQLMIHKPEEILAELLTFMSLNNGDIIMTGTPKGVGVIHKGDRFVAVVREKEEMIITKEWAAG